MDDQPSRVTEKPENLPGAMFGVPQVNKYLGKMPNFFTNHVSIWFLLEINKNKFTIAINFWVTCRKSKLLDLGIFGPGQTPRITRFGKFV